MPEDRKKGELDQYVEVDEKERVPHYEQKKWEEEHLGYEPTGQEGDSTCHSEFCTCALQF